MSMNTTRGDKYNSPIFNEEKTKTLNMLKSLNIAINYSKLYSIGNLRDKLLTLNISDGITLGSNQSLMTKYKAKDGTFNYLLSPNYKNSRRWYGEIYLPASTVVAIGGTDIKDVANGKNILRKGYILVTFDPLETTIGTNQYLKYDTSHNPWGGDDTSGYIFVQEKKGSKTDITSPTLPNGQIITNLPDNFNQTSAPIIIYDVSLRANNDFETTGTH